MKEKCRLAAEEETGIPSACKAESSGLFVSIEAPIGHAFQMTNELTTKDVFLRSPTITTLLLMLHC